MTTKELNARLEAAYDALSPDQQKVLGMKRPAEVLMRKGVLGPVSCEVFRTRIDQIKGLTVQPQPPKENYRVTVEVEVASSDAEHADAQVVKALSAAGIRLVSVEIRPSEDKGV